MNLPPIGFGTSPYGAGGAWIDVEDPVRLALDAGYRMFDVAEAYGNERAVGRALRTAPREELAFVGKAWRTSFRPEHLRAACVASLERLGIDAFDVYLLHAPDAWQHVAPLEDLESIGREELERRSVPRDGAGQVLQDPVALAETWAAMQELVADGLVREAGVSNFTREQAASLSPAPRVEQLPCWPFDPVREAAREAAVLVYSALRAGSLRGLRPEVVLSWLRSQNVRPIVFSTRAEHIRENLEVRELSAEDLAAIGLRLA
jgi:diketogulonate reductase-like aldo/keto reductase